MIANTQPDPAATAAKSDLKLFGIGTAGLNILGHLIASGFPGASCVALHSDGRSLASSGAAEKLHFGADCLRDLNDVDAKAPHPALEVHFLRLKELCANTRVVCILAGLGGTIATTASPLVARAAKEAGALVMAFVALPFDCEGNLRVQTAEEGLCRLKSVADLVFCLPNQRMIGLVNEAATLPDTFRTANQVAAACVRGTCRALQSENVMGVPFVELCQQIRERSAACSFAVAAASGPNRAADAVERLLAHPMLDKAAVSEQAEALAVWFVGGPDLGITEVNRVMELVQNQFPDVSAMMGASLSSETTDDLLVGLLVAQTEPEADDEGTEVERDTALGKRGEVNPAIQFLNRTATPRPQSRFIAPPPPVTPERLEQLGSRPGARGRKNSAKLRQTQLPLEIVSKGRFDKSEPTIHKGEDLDVPTYIRRGVALN